MSCCDTLSEKYTQLLIEKIELMNSELDLESKLLSSRREVKRLRKKLFEAELWVANDSYTFENCMKELNDYAEKEAKKND